jgi:hypothetical protein
MSASTPDGCVLRPPSGGVHGQSATPAEMRCRELLGTTLKHHRTHVGNVLSHINENRITTLLPGLV